MEKDRQHGWAQGMETSTPGSSAVFMQGWKEGCIGKVVGGHAAENHDCPARTPVPYSV